MQSSSIAVAARTFAKSVKAAARKSVKPSRQTARGAGSKDLGESVSKSDLELDPEETKPGEGSVLLGGAESLSVSSRPLGKTPRGVKTSAKDDKTASSNLTGSMSPTMQGDRSGATIRAIYRETRELLARGKVTLRLPPDETKGEVKGRASIRHVFCAVRKAAATVINRKRIAKLFFDALDESQLRRKLAAHVDKQLLDKISSGATNLVEFGNVRVIIDDMLEQISIRDTTEASKRTHSEKDLFIEGKSKENSYPTLQNQLSGMLAKFNVLQNLTTDADKGMANIRKVLEDRAAGVPTESSALEEPLGRLQDLAEDFSVGLDELRRLLSKFGVSEKTLEQWKPLWGLTSETCWFHTLVHKPVQALRKRSRVSVVKMSTERCEGLIMDYLKDVNKFMETTEIKVNKIKADEHRRSTTKRRSTGRESTSEGRRSVERQTARLSITKIGAEEMKEFEPSNQRRRAPTVKFQPEAAENLLQDMTRKNIFQGMVKQKVLKSGAASVLRQLESAERNRQALLQVDFGSALSVQPARRSVNNQIQRSSTAGSVAPSGRRLFQSLATADNLDASVKPMTARNTLTTEIMALADEEPPAQADDQQSEGSSSGDGIVRRESGRGFRRRERLSRRSTATRPVEDDQAKIRNSRDSVRTSSKPSNAERSSVSFKRRYNSRDSTADKDGPIDNTRRDAVIGHITRAGSVGSSSSSSLHSDHSESSEDEDFGPKLQAAGWCPSPQAVVPEESVHEGTPEGGTSKLDRFKEILRQVRRGHRASSHSSRYSTSSTNSQFFRTGGLREPGIGPRYMTNATTVDDVVTRRRDIQEYISGEAEEDERAGAESSVRDDQLPTAADLARELPRPQWDSNTLQYNPAGDTGKLNWVAIASGIATSRGRKHKPSLKNDVKLQQLDNCYHDVAGAAQEDATSQDSMDSELLGSMARYATMDPSSKWQPLERRPRSKQMLHIVCTPGDDFPNKLKRAPMSHSVSIWGQEDLIDKAKKNKSAIEENLITSQKTPKKTPQKGFSSILDEIPE